MRNIASAAVGGNRNYYRPEIDGLRALAVAAVIINHFDKNLLPSGYLGVDIFFVISGYVITWSLCSAPDAHLGNFLLDFYARRLKRLAPALLVCVAVTSVLVCLFDSNPNVPLNTGIASLFGLSNLYLFHISTDYFAQATELNVFTNTWSLGVEEQFYFVFPLVLWLSGLGQRSTSGTRHFSWIIGLASAASLAAFIYGSSNNPNAAFFLMPPRFWELGAGCLLFALLKNTSFEGRLAGIASAVALSALIVAQFLTFQHEGVSNIVVVALTAFLIATLRPRTVAYGVLTQRWVVYIGLISYSLYLWHWSVLSLSRWTIGIHWWSVPIQIGLMLLLASASYRYVEKPLRRAQWSAFRWKSVCYALSASVAVSSFLMLLSKPLEGKLYVGTKWASKEATASKILASYPNIYQRANDLRIKCNMTPHHLSGSAYRPKPLVDSAFLRACIESPTSSKKILLVGDSFASVSTYHLAVLADRLGYDFRVVFGYGCPFPLPFGEVKSHTTPKCREIDEKLIWQEVIRGLNAGDLLVVRLDLPKNQYIKYGSGRLPPVDAYDSVFGKLVSAATAKGAKVMVIGANPTLTLEQAQSLPAQWFNFSSAPSRGAIGPSDNQETAYYHLIDDHLQKYFAQFDGVSYFSLKRYLCDRASACRLADGPMLLYKDHEHLTSYAFDLFFDDLLGGVKALLSGAQSVSFQKDPS